MRNQASEPNRTHAAFYMSEELNRAGNAFAVDNNNKNDNNNNNNNQTA